MPKIPKKPAPRSVTRVEIAEEYPAFTTGVVCRLLDIPVWVLKQLDRERVVAPSRKTGRSRLYSKREVDRISHAWYYMRERRVNVNGVKVILEMEERFGPAE